MCSRPAASAAVRSCPHKHMQGKDIAPAGGYRFRRTARLGSNRSYRYVYRKGKSYPSRDLTLVYAKGHSVKVGFSVSSKVGNAVTRNRIRRFLREDLRMRLSLLRNGSYIFVARPCARDVPHERLTAQIDQVLRKASLFREEEQ